MSHGTTPDNSLPVRVARKGGLRPAFSVSDWSGPQLPIARYSAQVAPQHCVLANRSGKFWVRDLESGGRTFLNGWRVTGKKELKHGDRLRVGPLEFGIRLVQPVSSATGKDLADLLRPVARVPQGETLRTLTATRTGEEAASDSVGASASEVPLKPRPAIPQNSASVPNTPSATTGLFSATSVGRFTKQAPLVRWPSLASRCRRCTRVIRFNFHSNSHTPSAFPVFSRMKWNSVRETKFERTQPLTQPASGFPGTSFLPSPAM